MENEKENTMRLDAIDEEIKKVSRLIELLKEARALIDSLAPGQCSEIHCNFISASDAERE